MFDKDTAEKVECFKAGMIHIQSRNHSSFLVESPSHKIEAENIELRDSSRLVEASR